MKKRMLNRLTGGIIWTLFLLAGGALIYANLFNLQEGVLGSFRMEGQKLTALLAGAAMVLLALLHALTLARSRPRLKFVTFDSEHGAVAISVHAVRDFIRKVGEEFSVINQIDPKIHADRDQIRIDLDVKMVAGARVPELSQMLQTRVREGLRDGLGLDDVGAIRVRVQEIVGAPPPSKQEPIDE